MLLHLWADEEDSRGASSSPSDLLAISHMSTLSLIFLFREKKCKEQIQSIICHIKIMKKNQRCIDLSIPFLSLYNIFCPCQGSVCLNKVSDGPSLLWSLVFSFSLTAWHHYPILYIRKCKRVSNTYIYRQTINSVSVHDINILCINYGDKIITDIETDVLWVFKWFIQLTVSCLLHHEKFL